MLKIDLLKLSTPKQVIIILRTLSTVDLQPFLIVRE